MIEGSVLVSFCMSTYKRPELLQKQLSLLLSQTYTNFEIIVSDNDPEGSAKAIVEIVKDNRVVYYKNDFNLGMIGSFNKSFERSKGAYIVMITDDDPAYPDMLTTLLQLTKDYPGYGVYGGCGDLILKNEFVANTMGQKIGTKSTLLENMKVDEVKVMNKAELAGSYFEGFFSATYLLWSCLIVKREILAGLNGIPDYGSELLADHAYVIATGSAGGFVFINKSFGAQLVHGSNFGYDFKNLRSKYINTPQQFHDYLQLKLSNNLEWEKLEKKSWNFIGRSWVEYSLFIYKSLSNSKDKKEFFKAFNQAFRNKNIYKWKYKFYLKAYFKGLFNILLKFKQK